MISQEDRDAESIQFGSTLSNDQLADKRFDHTYTNPPEGKELKNDEDAVEQEAEKGYSGRFSASTLRIILPFVAG